MTRENIAATLRSACRSFSQPSHRLGPFAVRREIAGKARQRQRQRQRRSLIRRAKASSLDVSIVAIR